MNKYYDIDLFKSKALHKEISDKISKKIFTTISFLNSELSGDQKEIFQDSFKPYQPDKWEKNPNTWLSTIDINRVMEQYEDAYPNFQYLGANPIDFDKKMGNGVFLKLCKLDIKKDGKDCLGSGMIIW